MAGITLEQAQTQLTDALASLSRARQPGTSISGREVRPADIAKLEDSVRYWDRQVQRLTRGGLRVRTVEVDE